MPIYPIFYLLKGDYNLLGLDKWVIWDFLGVKQNDGKERGSCYDFSWSSVGNKGCFLGGLGFGVWGLGFRVT